VKEKWEMLASVVRDILTSYQKLLELGYQKREVLIQHNIQGIEAITKQEETLILKLDKLDEIRGNVIKEIARMRGFGDEKFTLSQISQGVEPETLYNIKSMEQEFSKVISEITQLNEVNKKIVEQAMLIVNCTLSLLSRSKADPTYNPSQNSSSMAHNRALFDHKV
jgi:flagellar biosynthesis/type III secretory pathway chaperone